MIVNLDNGILSIVWLRKNHDKEEEDDTSKEREIE